MAKIQINKDDNEKILCPHCEKEITKLIENTVGGGLITSKSIYACGNCRKVLPISHSTYAF